MAIKLKKLLLAIILSGFSPLFFAPVILQAQDSRIIHRFTWSGGEYALRYEVVFQRIENNEFVPHLREFTNERAIELSLPVGQYRFQVIPYDLLNRPSEPSQWSNVEVRRISQTAQPAEPTPVQPQPEIIIITEQPTISPPETQSAQPAELAEMAESAEPAEPAKPTPAQPQPEIIIITEQPTVSPPEVLDQIEPVSESSARFKFFPLYVNAAWSPVLPVYGEDLNITVTGFAARVSTIFEMPFDISIGPELTVAFDSGEHANLSIGVNLLALKWIVNEKAGLGFRMGIALPIISQHEQIYYNIGVSFRWHIINIFWVDGGVDYLHIFSDFSSGGLRPWIGLGLQF